MRDMPSKHKPALSPREDCARRALDTVMRGLGIVDAELAMSMGNITRSTIQSRRAGGVKLRPEQIEDMASALGVDPELFGMEPPEILRWLADNRPEQVIAASGWLDGTTGDARVYNFPTPEPALADVA